MVTKILLACVLTLLVSQAHSQQRTLYDASGRVVGRASTDSQGSTTAYDASGRVTGRASKSGDTTTIYDAAGRNVGRVTDGRARR